MEINVNLNVINEDAFQLEGVQKTFRNLGRRFYGVGTEVLNEKVGHLVKMLKLEKKVTVDFNSITSLSDMEWWQRGEAAIQLKFLLAELYVREEGLLDKLRGYRRSCQARNSIRNLANVRV